MDQNADNVVNQVNALPSWVLPLWANWPLILLGVAGLILFVYALRKFLPVLASLHLLAQKIANLSDQLGYYRRETLTNIQTIRQDLRDITVRVDVVERHLNIPTDGDPTASSDAPPSW